MTHDLHQELQRAHALLNLLPPAKLGAVRSLLEVMIDEDEEELTEDDRLALDESARHFKNGGQGLSLEQVVSELGFTIDQVRAAKIEP